MLMMNELDAAMRQAQALLRETVATMQLFLADRNRPAEQMQLVCEFLRINLWFDS